MLVPRPPLLPARRRAVPEMMVRVQQPQAISVGHVPPASVPTDELAGGDRRGVAPEAPSVRFTLSYTLREYLALLHEHVPAAVRKWELLHGKTPRERLSWHARAGLRLLVPLMCAPIFFLKKRRMPVCRFTVDRRGIERRTRAGVLRVDWKQVAWVHRYRTGYLVDIDSGALPIPYRCLDDEQRTDFERLLGDRLGARLLA